MLVQLDSHTEQGAKNDGEALADGNSWYPNAFLYSSCENYTFCPEDPVNR